MIEEERRLFYVGITRAKERLYMTHAFRRTRFGGPDLAAPSSFLAACRPATLVSQRPQKRRASMIAIPLLDVPVAPPMVERLHQVSRSSTARFGDGVVSAVADKSDDQEVTVDSCATAQKRLMASSRISASISNSERGHRRRHAVCRYGRRR